MKSDKMSFWVRLRFRVTQGHNVCENKNKRSQSMLVNGGSLKIEAFSYLFAIFKAVVSSDIQGI